MKKLLQLSILIHRAKILTTAKCFPAYFQIALLKALHNHYWFLSGISLTQKGAEPLLFYITWITCAAISTTHCSYNTLRSPLKQQIQSHFMYQGLRKKNHWIWFCLFFNGGGVEWKDLRNRGHRGKKSCLFLASSKNIQAKIIYLDANLIYQLIYTKAPFWIQTVKQVPSNGISLLCNLYARNFAMLKLIEIEGLFYFPSSPPQFSLRVKILSATQTNLCISKYVQSVICRR